MIEFDDYELIVPDTTGHRLHKAGEFVEGAVDIYAEPGSVVRAPGDGWVVQVIQLRYPLFGYEIRGYMTDQRKRVLGFVMAHLIQGSYPVPGQGFSQGDPVGRIAHWPAHPLSSHVHLSFRVGDRAPGADPLPKMPPPGNIRVERVLRRLIP